MRTRAEHFPLFNGLRGIAALAIVLYHGLYQPATYDRVGEWWWRYGIHLDVAVPVFLGISGFLLYHPFAAARERGGERPSLRRYGIRRLLRIVPAYWLWLTILVLWFWALPPGFEEVRRAEGAARFYGFAQIYDAQTAIKGIGQAWTVNVEVTFYLVLPLWILVARRFTLRTELIGLAAIVLASIAWKAWILSRVDPHDPGSLSSLLPLPTWLDHFAVGMAIAAVAVRRPEGPRRVWPLWVGAALFFAGACWIAGPDGTPEDPVTDTVYLVRHCFYTGTVACLVAAAVWGTGGLLRWRPLAYAGLISYSLYLVHTGVIRQQARWWGGAPEGTDGWIAWTAALTAASIALAAVGFHLVEKPLIRLGASRRRREQLAAPAGQATSRSSAS